MDKKNAPSRAGDDVCVWCDAPLTEDNASDLDPDEAECLDCDGHLSESVAPIIRRLLGLPEQGEE